MKNFLWVMTLGCLLLVYSCTSMATRGPQGDDSVVRATTPSPVRQNYSDIQPEDLCKRLSEIKQIPYAPNQENDDPIYMGLSRLGKRSVPCLVDKITDTTVIDDPRMAPPVNGFTTGDAAVFLLLLITGQQWEPETMMSPKYAKRWKNDGVYAYFEYVENRENRRRVQEWWRNWLKEHPKTSETPMPKQEE